MNLKRLEHVAYGEAEPSRFDTINVKIDLRHIGLKVTKQFADLRHCFGFLDELQRHRQQCVRPLAELIEDLELEAPS